MIIALVLCLFGVVAFAAYQFSEAKRWRQSAAEGRSEIERQRSELDEAKGLAVKKQAESEKNREIAETQLKLLSHTQQQLEEKFRALAVEALQANSQLFLDRSRDQIQHVVEPVHQSLRRFEEQVQALERARAGAYEGISAQVHALTQLQERVRQSAEELKTALRSPIQRGRWGEMQLRRVVEMAGMLEYCDFSEQETLFGETNQRPDLIVRLPNECKVVIDAKVSLEAYLRAVEAQDDAERVRYLKAHANQVKTHVKSLREKAYWERVGCSPEFVVAFLPLESLFSAALEHDPTLLDFAMERGVLIATPITLISLLLAVAHGWRQQIVAENVDKIRDAGVELYTRLLKMSENFAKLGSAIEKSVDLYNQTVGSLEKSVLPSARRLQELRPANAEQLTEVAEVEVVPRRLDSRKWPALEAAERN
jgi:DNA recombination protein RmuC